MKLFVLFLFVATTQLSARSYSQSINLHGNNISLKEAFRQVEKQTGYSFFIKNKLLKKAEPISISLRNATLDEAMHVLLKEQQLTYVVIGKTVILERQEIPGSNRIVEKESLPDRRITGTVKDAETGEPLGGVSVIVRGAKKGVTTNENGNYVLEVKNSEEVLEFSFVGYESLSIRIGVSQVINVSLKSKVSDLDEVVVIGYGTTRRGDLTGAISSVNSDVFDQSKQSSFINNLEGRVAGMQITSGTGEPGSGSKILIRGANSLSGDSRPLVVIDGIPVNESEAPIANSQFGANSPRDPLSSINPADIVSIDVLKDASSTAIYGARGANGVIVVTTRQGQSGDFKVTYDGRYSLSHIAKRMDMLNPDDWINYRKDYILLPDHKNQLLGYFQDWLFFENPSELEPSKKIPRDVYALPRYDWQDEMYRNIANGTNHNLSLSGGSQTTKMYGSIGYNQEEGLFINNAYSRFNGRFRIDHNKNRFSLSFGLNATYSRYNGAVQSGDGYANMGVVQTAIVSRPLVFVNPLAESTQGGWRMPTDNLNYMDRDISSPNLSSNLTLKYKLLHGLYISNTSSGTIVTSKANEYYSKNTPWGFYLNGRGAITNVNWRGWTNFSSLYYEKKISNHSKLSALGVFEVSGGNWENNFIIMSDFADESTKIHDISKGAVLQQIGSDAGIKHTVSTLGRLNYDLKSRYLFTTSLRRDGSDRFGPSNRYGLFPSAAFAWRISEESFMNSRWIDDLKLRLSYGNTGNSDIPEFRYMARMGNGFYDNKLGMTPSSIPNPNLKWETTVQYNIGLDGTFLDSRLNLTVDIYKKDTRDMLFNAIIPSQSGFKTQWQNLGKVTNKGIEIAITSTNIKSNEFSWKTSLTFALNRNEVIDIGNGLSMANVGAGYATTSYIKQNVVGRIMVGQPIGVMYGYKLEGIYQLDDFSGWKDRSGILPDNDPNILWQDRQWVLKKGVPDARNLGRIRPGVFKFQNLNGSEDLLITEDDKTVIGNGQPLFYGGLGNNFHYGSFDLSVFLNFSVGAKIFNSTKFELEGAMPNEYFNITQDFWDNRWTMDNPTNKYPAYSDENYYNSLASIPNDYYVEDASFLRVQTVSLSYSLPREIVNKLGLSNAKVYYSGNNLLTFTRYSGLWPEIDSGNPLLQNFDTIGYPRSKTHSVGLSVTF